MICVSYWIGALISEAEALRCSCTRFAYVGWAWVWVCVRRRSKSDVFDIQFLEFLRPFFCACVVLVNMIISRISRPFFPFSFIFPLVCIVQPDLLHLVLNHYRPQIFRSFYPLQFLTRDVTSIFFRYRYPTNLDLFTLTIFELVDSRIFVLELESFFFRSLYSQCFTYLVDPFSRVHVSFVQLYFSSPFTALRFFGFAGVTRLPFDLECYLLSNIESVITRRVSDASVIRGPCSLPSLVAHSYLNWLTETGPKHASAPCVSSTRTRIRQRSTITVWCGPAFTHSFFQLYLPCLPASWPNIYYSHLGLYLA